MSVIAFEDTEFGFRYGSATVTRAHADQKMGWVILDIETPKTSIQIYVTKGGKIRVYDESGEWFRQRCVGWRQ